jgi:transposase
MDIISTQEFISKYKHVNFLKMAKQESSKRVHERLLAIHHLCNEKNRHEAAGIMGRSDEWLRKWVLRYHNGGYDGLTSFKAPGRTTYLNSKQEKELVVEILKIQDERNGGRLTGNEIIDFIQKKYKVTYKGTSVYDLLERLGMSWVSSRSKHPKSDEKKQKTFKQTFKARATKIKAKKKAY